MTEAEAATTEPSRIGDAAGRLEREAARARATALFVEHGDLVHRVAVGLLRDRHEAEDAAQQTFLSAYRALADGTEPREPAAWLATIARNECLARIRSRMRSPVAAPLEEVAAPSDVHGEALSRSHARRLWREIRSLPDQQRDAVILREFAGLSYEELAVALGISKPAVESLLFRARGRLRERLEAAFATLNLAGILSTLADAAGRVIGSGAAQPAAAKIVAAGAAAALVGGGGVVVADHVGPPQHREAAAHAARVVPPPRPVATAPAAAPVVSTVAAVAPVAALTRRPEHAQGSHDHGEAVGHRGEHVRTTSEDGGSTASVQQSGGHEDGSSAAGRRTAASETTDGHDHQQTDAVTTTTTGGDSGRDAGSDSSGDGGGDVQAASTVIQLTTTVQQPTPTTTTTDPTETSGGDGGSASDG